ncbi:unnamed protein product [Schistosoma curassoni]|uniref:Lig_chan-Glu_bd domain-containing protein n=1 Tax=Schistosoma curassoni TaxID=6186 RepID=A0A183JNG2_9TREM|nr:unnamed protein product [Schistosoma curassoni]
MCIELFKLHYSMNYGEITYIQWYTSKRRKIKHNDPPFVIFEPYRQGVHLEGNDQWTGFAMELLQHLSKMNHFDYIIKPVSDKKFGTFDESKGKWDGLIGDLVYKKADLAVASFTITYDRERVIDFTTPFMSLSLSVIIQKSNSDPGLQFTAPLSNEVSLFVCTYKNAKLVLKIYNFNKFYRELSCLEILFSLQTDND